MFQAQSAYEISVMDSALDQLCTALRIDVINI